jgi:hypothetical protein
MRKGTIKNTKTLYKTAVFDMAQCAAKQKPGKKIIKCIIYNKIYLAGSHQTL